MKTEQNVLNQQDIDKWKAEYGKIFKSTIDGEVYIWRKLKRNEYVEVSLSEEKSLKGIEDSQEIEKIENENFYKRQEKITNYVLLYPKNKEKIIADNAGLASALSNICLDKSGFEIQKTEEI